MTAVGRFEPSKRELIGPLKWLLSAKAVDQFRSNLTLSIGLDAGYYDLCHQGRISPCRYFLLFGRSSSAQPESIQISSFD
jgi:hypothetical protein